MKEQKVSNKIYSYDGMNVICDGGDDNSGDKSNMSTEELIASTVSSVLKEQKEADDNNSQPPADPDPDPFDFSDFDNGNQGNQNIDQNIDQNNQGDQNNDNNNQNINDQNNLNNSRFETLEQGMENNRLNNIANKRTSDMTMFMTELNNAVAEIPELGVHRNKAIDEAKRSINSGGYIPANEMLNYLHGQAAINSLKTKEVNNNPDIGGKTDLNPDGSEKKLDLDSMSVEEMQSQFGHVQF